MLREITCIPSFDENTKVARSLLSSNVGHCIKTVYHSLVVKFTTWACNLHPRHTRQIKKAASVTSLQFEKNINSAGVGRMPHG